MGLDAIAAQRERGGWRVSLPWVRLDTAFGDNPKVLGLIGERKHRAVLAYVLGLAYSGKHELGGFIPRGALPVLHATTGDARALVDARLWHETPKGWQINDFGDYQVTNVTQENRINAAKVAACKRWHTQPCSKCLPVDEGVS